MRSPVHQPRCFKSFRLIASAAAVAVIVAVAWPAQAMAVDPEATVGGAGSDWYSGTLLQQSGQNCSIIGGSYSETMVSAIAGYGGAPGGGVVRLGDRYYASLLVSIPGNPCGSGSTFIGTDLVLPRGTAYDSSAAIRCFGIPRNASDFIELTGGNWSYTFMNGSSSSDSWCPATVGNSMTSTSGAIGVGYRPLANGQMYQLFVPIKSTLELTGPLASPADEIRWILSSSGTYSNTGQTSVWTNVFATSRAPYIYFARNPSVVPFWNATAVGNENQAEWFANLYSNFQPGTFCFYLYAGPSVAGSPVTSCTSPDVTWSSAITAASDSWQIYGTGASAGPNGGYVPFAYDPSETYTIRWIFTTDSGSSFTKDITFTTLAGPDQDGDGIPNNGTDQCPTVKGTLPNGCQPAVQTDPDADGIFGAADLCPTANGTGTINGCPIASAVPPVDPPPILPVVNPCLLTPTASGCPIGGAIGAIKGNKLKRKDLAKGALVAISCNADSKAVAALTITAKVAKKLKLKVKRKAKTFVIGSARGSCTTAKKSALKLKFNKASKRKILKSRKAVPASLSVTFTRPGSALVTAIRALKLT